MIYFPFSKNKIYINFYECDHYQEWYFQKKKRIIESNI